jgi:uncharacterized protein (UPF0332 family)
MNGSAGALVEKARRYLRSAEILRAAGDFDSAASRCYYAMFYAAEAAVFVKGLTFRSHRAVLSGFGQHLVKTGELPTEMHQWILDAFDKRQMGDYLPVSPLDEQDIQDLQAKAVAFVDRVESWLRERGAL